MALLTKSGFKSLLTRLWDSGGLTEDMETDLKRLQDDFDEREGMLRKFGEVYDGEDKDEYEYTAKEASGEDWEAKYNDMKNRYVSRFFNGEETRADGDADDFKTVLDAQEEDVQRDGSPQSFDDLLGTSYQQETDKGVNG